ncbi:hypothetical protein [Pseudomonas moorei]|uniref:hypothetical protein n=1 Tax=Pseudomonas moorei TaxID=395599 RepID=UPI0036F31744
MRNLDNISTIDLHIDTQQPKKYGVRTSVYLQALLKSNVLENIVVRSAHRKHHDVGAWCFTGKKSVRLPKTVEVSLHRPERAKPIQNLVSEVITMACSDKTAAGAGSKLADFALIVNFCNNSDLIGFLESPESYQCALQAFTTHLKESNRKEVTQAKLQSVAIECGSYLFPESKIDFSAGIERIQSITDKSSSTKPPPEAPVKRFVNVFTSVFNELSDFTLSKHLFPHAIKIDNERAVLTTEAYPFLTDSVVTNKVRSGHISRYVDYETGKCKLWSEVHKENPNANYKNYQSFAYKSANRLAEGNSDLYCQRMVRLHKLAHDSFVALFALNSGENESTIISTPWNGAYEISKGSIGTRIISIKQRGGVQPITFTVAAPFVKHFKKFIELRKHILNGHQFDKLFIGFDYRTISEFRQLDENLLRNLCVQMQAMVDPAFPMLSYKKLRAYKDSWLVKNYDQDTAAALLHHSDKTQRASYTNVEEKEAIDRIVEAVRKIVNMLDSAEHLRVPSGLCSGAKPTSAVSIPPGYEPDCKNSRGCLFCNEFRVTPEPESIHKLYSLEYVIKKFLGTCNDLDHFNLIHQPALEIIEKLLNRIHEINPTAIADSKIIRKRVYDERELTEYWTKYLERFIKIGAIR